MKILLCVFQTIEAYGLRIIQSILNEHHDCRLLFLNDDKIDVECLCNFLKDYKPDILGFSLVSPNFRTYKQLYPHIRKCGDFKILLGGWQATLDTTNCLPYCDVVCKGEGELIIEKIVEDIKNDDYHRVYNAPLNKFVQYPLVKFDKSMILGKNKITYRDPYELHYRYSTMIGRGCPHSCTYCSNSYMKSLYPEWSKIRYREYEDVLEELKYAKSKMKNLNTILFLDETLVPKNEDFYNFLKEYKKEINLSFYCLFYPGSCKEDLIIKLKEAGLEGIWLGVQCGNEKLRKELYGRGGSNKQIIEQAKLFMKHNVKIRYDFIFRNPLETKEEFEDTLELLKILPKPFSINLFSMSFFPNTKITKIAIEKGIIEKPVDYFPPSSWPFGCLYIDDNNIFLQIEEIRKMNENW